MRGRVSFSRGANDDSNRLIYPAGASLSHDICETELAYINRPVDPLKPDRSRATREYSTPPPYLGLAESVQQGTEQGGYTLLPPSLHSQCAGAPFQ